jgi:hypothetical protein
MPPSITLTQEQIDKIESEMFEKDDMLSDSEVQLLAQKVNEKINLPFLKEEKEFIVFFKIIKFIDKALYQLLPNEYYGLIKDATDGISREEARIIIKRLTPLVNNVINIPILTEKQEALAIEIVLKLIVNAMVKGNRIAGATVTSL